MKKMMVVLTMALLAVFLMTTAVLADGPRPSTESRPAVTADPQPQVDVSSVEQIHMWKLTLVGGYLSKVLKPQGLIAEKYELIIGANKEWDQNSWQDANTGETICNRFTDDCTGFDLDSGSGPRKKISCFMQYSTGDPTIYLYIYIQAGNRYVVFSTKSFYNQSGQGDLAGFYTGETMRYSPQSLRWIVERIFGGVFQAEPEQ